jgi:hypothetical protein
MIYGRRLWIKLQFVFEHLFFVLHILLVTDSQVIYVAVHGCNRAAIPLSLF